MKLNPFVSVYRSDYIYIYSDYSNFKRENVDVVMVFDFARNPPFRERDEEKPRRSGKVSTHYTEMTVLDSFILNQVESIELASVPFTLCIAKERGNLESSNCLNLLKWPFALSTCAILFFCCEMNEFPKQVKMFIFQVIMLEVFNEFFFSLHIV